MDRRQFIGVAALAQAALNGQDTPASRFRIENGRYSFGPIENARLVLEVNGKMLDAANASDVSSTGGLESGQSGRLQVRFRNPGVSWEITFEFDPNGSAATIHSTVWNRGAAPIALGRCSLAEISGASRLNMGRDAKDTVLLAISGWQAPSRVRKISGLQSSKIVAQLHNRSSGVSAQLGFVTIDRINTQHDFWWNEEQQCLNGRSYCDFNGFSLAPGTRVESEKLLIQFHRDPHESLAKFAGSVQAHYKPRIWADAPAGWLGWAWVDPLDIERYEDVVRRNTRAIRERLPGLDINYIWISIGNLAGTLPGNWLNWNADLFPSGREALIRDLASQGFRLGLWCGAYWLNTHLDSLVHQLDGAFLQQDGKPLLLPSADWGNSYALDPTHPKTLAFLQQVFSTYREWGVKYFMLDFLDAASGNTLGPAAKDGRLQLRNDGYHNGQLISGPEAFRKAFQVIREASGPDTYLLACTGPSFQHVGLADGARVGNDYGEGRPLRGPGGGMAPGTFAINKPDFWTSHLYASNAMASHSFFHRKLFLCDSGNVLTVDKPVGLPDAQISATIFGINGGPIMLGDDIDRISEERLHIIRTLFPRCPECARAIDLFETPEPDHPKLFHLPIRTAWENWHLLALFNYGESPLERNVSLTSLGVQSTEHHVIWDFWNERYLGTATERVSVWAAPRSVTLLRISPMRKHPWLLSTDMHIRQGQVEIQKINWDGTARRLTISATRPKGYTSNLYLRVPPGLALKNPAGRWIAKDANEGCLIVRVAMNFATDTSSRESIDFVPYRK
jgi:hypothetical protein